MEAAEHRRMTEIDDLGELFSRAPQVSARHLAPLNLRHQSSPGAGTAHGDPTRTVASQPACPDSGHRAATTQVVDDLVELGCSLAWPTPSIGGQCWSVPARRDPAGRADQRDRGQQAHELLGGLSVDDRAELRRLLLILETGQAAR